MLMNFLSGIFLLLIVQAFDYVSSQETKPKKGASFTLELKSPQNVHIGVNEKLELNCTSNRPIRDLRPAKLLWQHNKVWIPNNTYVVDDYTVQLKITKTSYGDAGCYSCGLFNISSNSHSTNSGYSQNVTVIVGEKPNKPNLTLVSVFGRPVQELTLQWPAKDTSASYELLLGRVQNGSLPCNFDNMTAISIKTFQGSKHDGVLSYHVTREDLGKLFTWDELYSKTLGNCVLLLGTTKVGSRCDQFCAYVVAKNGFGTSQSQKQKWNLIEHARCPSPANLNVVVINDNSMKLRWQHPSLVLGPVYYKLAVTVTSVLTEKTFPLGTTFPLIATEAVSHTIEGQVDPYTKYRFWVSCCFSPVCSSEGPPAYREVVTQEIAPSGKPICEVRNRSSDGQAYVMVKIPPKETWNGIPKRVALQYGNHQKIINVSHEELVHLNRSLEIDIHVNGLDVHSNYSVTAAFCTVGGCGNYSSPCFMYAGSEDPILKDAAVEGMEKKKWETWKVVSVGVGLFVGLVLVLIVYSCWIKRRRSRRTRNIQPLGTVFKSSSLNSVHAYENHVDDGPKMCEESSNYDRLRTGSSLLKDEDCTLGNISVSKI